jgi:hypothetical protein
LRILIGVLLVIMSHTLTAGCPKKEMPEFVSMTKEELIATYCTNMGDYGNDKGIYDAWMRIFTDTVKIGALGMADSSKKKAHQYHDRMICDMENYKNAFHVLCKEHGVEKEEDIKCDK